jgi:hypothetical protein
VDYGGGRVGIPSWGFTGIISRQVGVGIACRRIGMAWSIGQFPELEYLEPGERAAVLGGVPWWTYPVIVGRAVLGALVLGGLVVGMILRRVGPGVRWAAYAVVVCGVAVGLYFLQLRRVRRLMRREIAVAFRGERPPFCFGCGYDLRGSGAGRCPECGRAIVRGGVE